MQADLRNLERLDEVILPALLAARIPGAAIAVVADGQTILAKAYGYRDRDARLPMNADTVYPIASTSKAFNATLLGMLVDERTLAWDAPVQTYLPRFQLGDSYISAHVTVRDLVTMRTGLPRHGWVWLDAPISRAELVGRLRHLELSAGFRERFQYNNLTATVAGHVAEVVTGRSWESLVQQRILDPLGMSATGFCQPSGNTTLSYHENSKRDLLPTRRMATQVTAPSGGAMHSTVEDMARWIAVNLAGGRVAQRPLISAATLAEIHSAQIPIGARTPTELSPDACYAMGWIVDQYRSCPRLFHGGDLHDVTSDVMLFPSMGIGMVSFTNFRAPLSARQLNEWVFDLLMGWESERTIEAVLSKYEWQINATRQHNTSARRVARTSPSHLLTDYAGVYEHAGYGVIELHADDGALVFQRNSLTLPLQHWHYDAWIAQDQDSFPLATPHAFDPTSPLLFETNAAGEIAAVTLRLEPAVAPIRFQRH